MLMMYYNYTVINMSTPEKHERKILYIADKSLHFYDSF